MRLSFYDHHRQSYGHMPIRENPAAEFMVGDYGEPGEDQGVDKGGEFAIHLIALGNGSAPFGRDQYLAPVLRVFHDATGSLRAFLDSGAWDAICERAARHEIRRRDDLTELLLAAGLYDRSEHPVGYEPVCHCCGQPTPALTKKQP